MLASFGAQSLCRLCCFQGIGRPVRLTSTISPPPTLISGTSYILRSNHALSISLRLARSAAASNSLSSFSTRPPIDRRRYAMLVDAENTSYAAMPLIVDELASLGDIIARRAYGDFTKTNLSPWKNVSLDLSLRPTIAFAYTSGKNSSDSALIIDAMDLLHEKGDALDGFVVVSSDSDFTGLAQRLRESGKHVVGVGRAKTPAPFVAACERFIYIENLDGSTSTETEAEPLGKQPVPVKLISQAVENAAKSVGDDNGKVELGMLGTQLLQLRSNFDVRTYGFNSLKKMLLSLPDIFRLSKKTPPHGV